MGALKGIIKALSEALSVGKKADGAARAGDDGALGTYPNRAGNQAPTMDGGPQSTIDEGAADVGPSSGDAEAAKDWFVTKPSNDELLEVSARKADEGEIAPLNHAENVALAKAGLTPKVGVPVLSSMLLAYLPHIMVGTAAVYYGQKMLRGA